jgi:Uma2 family endonuclease
MPTLTIPPERLEDVDLVKDYLFETMGESFWTDEDYLLYSDRYPRLTELSEGRLVILDVPTPAHQRVVKNVLKQLDAWAEPRGGETLMAPMPVRLWPGKFREPDVMVYTAERRDRIGSQFGDPPDLVVEVQSPGTARIDSTEKREEYAQAGIPEYWTIALDPPRLEQCVLQGGRYALRAALAPGDTVASASLPGLAIPLKAIFGDQ